VSNTTPQTFTVKDGDTSITFTHDPLFDGPLENVLPGSVVAQSDSVTVARIYKSGCEISPPTTGGDVVITNGGGMISEELYKESEMKLMYWLANVMFGGKEVANG